VKLSDIDLDKKENLMPVKKVDVVFAVRAKIDQLEKYKKVSSLQLMEFFTS